MEKRLSDEDFVENLVSKIIVGDIAEGCYDTYAEKAILQALQSGQLIRADRLLSESEIKDTIESYGCDMGDSLDISHSRVDELAKTIHDKLKGAL